MVRPSPRLWRAAILVLGIFLIGQPGTVRGACGIVPVAGGKADLAGFKLFVDWDPARKRQTLIVQPNFQRATGDFVVIVPTPTTPEASAAPRDFFRGLGTFTTLKRRTFPQSNLLPSPERKLAGGLRPAASIRVLEEGMTGPVKFQVISADKPGALLAWLKDQNCPVDRADPALAGYLEKKWAFTVFRVDPRTLPADSNGDRSGDAPPIQLTFATDQPIAPLRIAGLRGSERGAERANEPIDGWFYVQAPFKVDLPGEGTYQYQWLPTLQTSLGGYPKGMLADAELPGGGDAFLKAAKDHIPELYKKAEELGFVYTNKSRPWPNKKGRLPATLEWAKRLTASDLRVIRGELPYSESPPDLDEGFSEADLKNPLRAEAIFKVLIRRRDRQLAERPGGYMVRTAPPADKKALNELAPFLKDGMFLTKFRKVFTRTELNEDILFGQARVGPIEDVSEYEEVLPSTPP